MTASRHPACKLCDHVHRVTQSGPNADPVTYDQRCGICGCTGSGRQYEIGPSILDSPMIGLR